MSDDGVSGRPAAAYEALAANIERVIVGKPEVVRLVITALFAEGHLLIEDVPGLGKTILARSLARSIKGEFGRIQFTPDLLPGDITGTSVYHQDDGTFPFHPGPVFNNVVLADEINRGTPKTQSALLEVMAEQQVTVDGKSYLVPSPFMVLATQNPIEMGGTYRLPEAQLDRFLMRIGIGPPDLQAEVDILLRDVRGMGPDQLHPVLDVEELRAVITDVRCLHVEPMIAQYIASIAQKTRAHPNVQHGVSPRGSVALLRAARAAAAVSGQKGVRPDDVKAVAHAVLDHRIHLTPEAELTDKLSFDVVSDALQEVPVPVPFPAAR